jgi:phosphotriesterase-related protein
MLTQPIMQSVGEVAASPQSEPAMIPNMAGKVLTVNGPIDPDDLGTTMMHEHILARFDNPSSDPPSETTKLNFYNRPLTIDMLGSVLNMGYRNKDNLILGDEQMAIEELRDYKMQGGNGVVDVTSIGLGRDPQGLRRVANATQIHIIMGSSWYTKDYHPKEMDERSVESLTQEIVRDVTVGVGDSWIRSGIIGAVGTVGNPLTPNEIKVIRASGRASRLTGAAVSLHTAAGITEHEKILDLLQAEGTDLGRVIVGHSDWLVKELPFLKRLLERGVYIEFDHLGKLSRLRKGTTGHVDVSGGIVELIQTGYLDRILLSQNVNRKVDLKAYGGLGYSFVHELFIPLLRRLGVTEEQVEMMVVTNPKRVLTFAAPRPAK